MAVEDVVIIGGGPVGLMLAIELRLAGVQPVVLEQQPEISQIPKGNGLVGQIVPMLDCRGLLEPCRAEATFAGPVPRFQFGTVDLDFSPLGVSPLHIIGIPQRRLEYVLDQRLHELGGSVRRGHEMLSFTDAGDHVAVDVRGPDGDYGIHANYLVGADGARSRVRKESGIGFPGTTSGEISRIGRVTLPAELIDAATGEVNLPGYGVLRPTVRTRTATGAFSVAPLSFLDRTAEPGVYIVSTSEEHGGGPADTEEPMTLAELSTSTERVLSTPLPMSDPVWLTRTVGNTRQADRYRTGRILLAGDAAHLFGLGGSLNVGLLDAVNLGWKLAATVHGTAPVGLLDTYHAERHAAGERALMSAQAQRLLSGPGDEAAAMRALLHELAAYPEALRHLGKLIQSSDIGYPTGPAGPAQRHAHPLQGLPAPDITVVTDDGKTRIAELMRAARPLLLDLTGGDGAGEEISERTPSSIAEAWKDTVTILRARPADPGQSPAAALLIRPDGHVAWATGPDAADPAAGLRETLEFWFGQPR